MRVVSGVDDVNRAPVLGPLHIAIATATPKQIKILQELGVKDSKLLTKKERYELLHPIIDTIKYWNVTFIPASLITPETNLNVLEMRRYAKLIDKAWQIFGKHKTYIDNFERSASKFITRLKQLLKQTPLTYLQPTKRYLKPEHDADKKYTIVSAASIIAKVMSDWYLDDVRNYYKENYGIEIGSGNPYDRKTLRFIKLVLLGEIPDDFNLIRYKWQTVQRLQKLINVGD